MQTSYMAKEKDLKKQWFVIDAQNMVLGRMANTVATILMGKHHPWYTPHMDTGDFVIILNADKVKVTGKKKEEKIYYFWSGYPGGLKKRTMGDISEKTPEKLIHLAVRRMMPKTRMGRKMMKKLKIYVGSDHPHEAQMPKEWNNQPVRLKEVLINE